MLPGHRMIGRTAVSDPRAAAVEKATANEASLTARGAAAHADAEWYATAIGPPAGGDKQCGRKPVVRSIWIACKLIT